MAYTFISGATGGIGKAFCKEIAMQGAEIFITGRSEEKLVSLKNELLSLGAGAAEYFPCDLTDENSRKSMLEFIDARGLKFDRIRIFEVYRRKAFVSASGERGSDDRAYARAVKKKGGRKNLGYHDSEYVRREAYAVFCGVFGDEGDAYKSVYRTSLRAESGKRERDGGHAGRRTHPSRYNRGYKRAGALGKAFE